MTGGASSAGGGTIYNSQAALSLRRVEIADSMASDSSGGAIYNDGGEMRLEHVTIANSGATNADGGGIYTTGPTRLTDSSVVGCQATTTQWMHIYGGGIYSTERLELVRSKISENLVSANGGNNYSSAGGGISSSGSVLIVDSSITRNGNGPQLAQLRSWRRHPSGWQNA
jgi:hypothetical protein